MKTLVKKLFVTLFMIGAMSAMAQSLSARHADYSQSSLSFHSTPLTLTIQKIAGANYVELQMEGASPSTAIGRPNLPIVTEMIEIPLCANVKVDVSNVVTKKLNNVKCRVMPVQPSVSKSERTPHAFVIDSQFYAQNTLSEGPLAWVEKVGVARDRNVALLRVSPVSYNPVTGELQQVESMDITLTYVDADIPATMQLHQRYYSPEFSLGHRFVIELPCTKQIRNAAPLHYLIVAHSSFRGYLDTFIDWKKRQGFIVTVGYTDEPEVGTTSTSIAAYTKSFYTNATEALPAPTYLLLVGDVQQIPAFNSRCQYPASNHVSDLYYVTWTDGDDVPDCYQGRFSARTVAELTPQIEKTIYYESYAFADDSYLGRGILIAGEDGGYSSDYAYRYADPAMDYIAKYYINAANGYNTVHYYKNNVSFAPNGVTVDGSCSTTASASALRNYYNQGYGWINYSAHGNDNEWYKPSFTTTHVASMTNNNMPSIMIGNCCLSGRFNTTSYDACLGEALLRKGNNAGAVVYFGGTNSTYWGQDFCWAVGVRNSISNTMDATYDAANLGAYDRLFHTHAEPQTAWHTTAGSINVAGNTAVVEYGSFANYYWEIYELFGDPSLMPWLGVAREMSVVADPIIPIGLASYTVNAEPYAYVAITSAETHELVAAAFANANGVAELAIPADVAPGNYELAVWAQNCKPVFIDVNALLLDEAYLAMCELTPNSPLQPGHVVTFNAKVVNLGSRPAAGGTIVFASANANASVIRQNAAVAACAPGDTIVLTDVCATYISEKNLNGAKLRITANIDFGADISSSVAFHFVVAAPQLQLLSTSVDEPINTSTVSHVTLSVANQGGLATPDLTFAISSPYGLLAAEPAPVNYGVLQAGATATLTFDVILDEDAPDTDIPFTLIAQDADTMFRVAEFVLRHGAVNTEDFESGAVEFPNVSYNNYPWVVTNETSHEGNYCIRSAQNLGNSRTSLMTFTYTAESSDSIKFYYKVSSEENYDFFSFKIDDNERIQLSGEVDWTRAAFYVPAGTHTFAFEYSKDYSTIGGSDCAWIDMITFPFVGTRADFVSDTVCLNAEYEWGGEVVPTDEVGLILRNQTVNNTVYYLALFVEPEPVVTIESVDYGNGYRLLKAHGAQSYVWSTGEEAAAIVVNPQYTSGISVIGYSHGCTAEAYIDGVIYQGISDVDTPSASLYPNPAHNRVSVASEGMQSVQLINLMGQVIYTQKASASNVELDLQHVPSGVYFVRINTAHGSIVKKLVRK